MYDDYKARQRQNRVVLRLARTGAGLEKYVWWKVPRSGGRLPPVALKHIFKPKLVI